MPYDTDAFEASATAAVEECVRRQVEVGLDLINDGGQRKSGFITYLTERLAGFEAVPYAPGEPLGYWREVDEFPEYYDQLHAPRHSAGEDPLPHLLRD